MLPLNRQLGSELLTCVAVVLILLVAVLTVPVATGISEGKFVSTQQDNLNQEDEPTEVAQNSSRFFINTTQVPDSVNRGEEVEVESKITNIGSQQATQTVRLIAGGDVVDSREIELESGENATTVLTWVPDEEQRGNHSMLVQTDTDTVIESISIADNSGGRTGTNSNESRDSGVIALLPVLFFLGGVFGVTAGVGISPQIRSSLPGVTNTGYESKTQDNGIIEIYQKLYGVKHQPDIERSHESEPNRGNELSTGARTTKDRLNPESQRDQDKPHGAESHQILEPTINERSAEDQFDRTPEECKNQILEHIDEEKIVLLTFNNQDIEKTAESIIESHGKSVPDGTNEKIQTALDLADDSGSSLPEINDLEDFEFNRISDENEDKSREIITSLLDFSQGELDRENFIKRIDDILSESRIHTDPKVANLTTRLDSVILDIDNETGKDLVRDIQKFEKGEIDVETLVTTVETTIQELSDRNQSGQNDKLIRSLNTISSNQNINSVYKVVDDMRETLIQFERGRVNENTVVDQLEDVNKKISDLKQEKRKARRQKRDYSRKLERIDAEIKRDWIEDHTEEKVGEEPGDLSEHAIQADLVGELVVQKAARNVQADADQGKTDFRPGSQSHKFIKELASAKPTHEDEKELRSTLKRKAEKLSEYKEFDAIERKNLADIEQKYDELTDLMVQVSDPQKSVIKDVAENEYKQAQMLKEGALIEPSLIYERLQAIEDLLNKFRQEDKSREDTLDTSEIDKRHEEIQETIKKINNIKSGHRIARWYLEVADELREEAVTASESDNRSAAKAYLNAEYLLVDKIYKMYSRDELVDVLAWTGE